MQHQSSYGLTHTFHTSACNVQQVDFILAAATRRPAWPCVSRPATSARHPRPGREAYLAAAWAGWRASGGLVKPMTFHEVGSMLVSASTSNSCAPTAVTHTRRS
jgi:hypothetical protein